MLIKRLMVLVSVGAVSVCVSAGDDGSLPSFVMECTDKETHGFRHEYHVVEERMFNDRLWTTDEKFNSTWQFRYDSDSRSLSLDNEDVPYDAMALTIIAIEKAVGMSGHSQWSYVLHPYLNQAAAVQVNGFTSLTTGLKARMVEFDCKTAISE